jgi:hypothetical protein
MRVTPFELVFGQLAESRFPAIKERLRESEWDATDRDAFLMMPEVVTLVRELRPEEGMGEAIDQLVALLHHAYLFWLAGAPILTLEREATDALVGGAGARSGPDDASAEPASFYCQLAPRRIWAQLFPEQPAEPMDGCFISHRGADQLRVLGVFGMHPERVGFSVAEAGGPRLPLEREDHTPLFAPAIPGGAEAGLHQVTGSEELVELGWRAVDLAQHAGPVPARPTAE